MHLQPTIATTSVFAFAALAAGIAFAPAQVGAVKHCPLGTKPRGRGRPTACLETSPKLSDFSNTQPTISPALHDGNDVLDFIILGDWGSNNKGQKDVAHAMEKVVAKHKSQFVISVGDNFYPDKSRETTATYEGVKSADDPKWQLFFKDIYDGSLTNIPFLSTLGNHDWMQNPQAQIDHTSIDDQWHAHNYFWHVTLPVGKDAQATFLFVDTDLLYYDYTGTNRPIIYENFAKNGWTPENQTVEHQLAWIERKLAYFTSVSKYVFVVGHHPLETCKNENHMGELHKLVKKYNPTAYLFGHSHALQYASTKPETTMYIQSGAGSISEEPCDDGKSAWSIGDIFGFVHARVDESSVKFDYILSNGTIVYSINA